MYEGNSLLVNGKEHRVDFVVAPYAPEKELLVGHKDGGVFITKSLAKKLRLDEGDRHVISITYDDHKQSNEQLPLAGVVDERKINTFMKQKNIVYLPYEWFSQIDEIHALVGYVDETVYASAVSGYVHWIDAELFVKGRLADFVIGNYEMQSLMEAFAPMI